jgi:tetratricopeptide (TPR) repeat protein
VLIQKALADAEAFGAEDLAAHALRGIGTIRASQGDEGGLDEIERSIELGEKLNDPLTIHQGCNNLANMHWHFGRIAEGARYLERDREAQERFGLTSESGTVRWLEGEMVLYLEMVGDWSDALQRAEEFIAAVAGERHYLTGVCLALGGELRLVQGDLQGALADSERALEFAREVKDPQQLLPTLMFRARSLLHAGRERESNELLDELLEAGPMINEYWFRELPWVLLEHGREAAYLQAAKTAAKTPWLQAGVATASRDFAASAAIYERIGARGAEAVARLHVAEELAAQGRLTLAHEELTAAQNFFLGEGATPYLRRCEALLAAAS